MLRGDTPKSLSATYYMMPGWKRILFPLLMYLLSALILPAWLSLDLYQPLVFLSIGGLLFVGTAPAFLRSKLTDMVHTISAILAAYFTLLWIILVGDAVYIFFNTFIAILFIFLLKDIRNSKIFIIENIAIYSLFESLCVRL